MANGSQCRGVTLDASVFGLVVLFFFGFSGFPLMPCDVWDEFCQFVLNSEDRNQIGYLWEI